MTVEMAALDEVLARYDIGMTSAEVVAELDAAFASMNRVDTTPLSESEMQFLVDHGGPGVAEALASYDPVAERDRQARRAVDELATTMRSTVSIAEAALLLGVDRSRISHRIAQGTLWAFRVGRSPRIPRWQFCADGKLLPGLPQIIAAIPAGLAPQSVAAFMSTPQEELYGLTPVDYLCDDGDPAIAADLLACLGLW